ncbi:MAG: helicase, partial [Sphingobacteriia bacterium]|nr:helicase [Sphingobacteriia bacterium]
MIDINPKFLQVLDFINQTNQPLFLTGKAGTGKTTLLKYIREKTQKQLAVVAPTGVAAINAGGATIHSFFQFPFKPFIPALQANGQVQHGASQLGSLKYTSQRLSIFRRLELLIIDEVSMVRADLLDQIDQTLRMTRRRLHLPFGGVQVLLIGDMYQLPPVVPAEDWQLLSTVYKSPFFFDSLAMRNHPPVYIELKKIYRQTDQDFITLLNKHYQANISEKEYQENITLTTHNRKADEINGRNLA